MSASPVAFAVALLAGGVILAALGPGYLLWLLRSRPRQTGQSPGTPLELPQIDVIVPVSNEAQLISRKLRNLRALRYPTERLSIFIVDGASTDGTDAVVRDFARRDPRVTFVPTGTADKTLQLNSALARSSAPWIVVTDADAELPPATLRALVDVAEARSGVSVVGTPLTPSTRYPLELLYWRISNFVRRLESRRGSASTVVAPCYLFRRSLVDRFPADVVADDLYVSFAAAAAGDSIGFADVDVLELRSPRDAREFFAHKRRKAAAYLRELFRFAPAIRRMPAASRIGFIWRGLQLTVAPVLGIAYCLGVAIELAARPWLAGLAGLLALACLAGWRRSVGTPALASVRLVALLTIVVLSTLVRYPWVRQTASYPKVASGGV